MSGKQVQILTEQHQSLQEKIQRGKQIAAQFFGGETADLQQLRRERQQLIQQVMGQIEGYEKLLVGPAGGGV